MWWRFIIALSLSLGCKASTSPDVEGETSSDDGKDAERPTNRTSEGGDMIAITVTRRS